MDLQAVVTSMFVWIASVTTYLVPAVGPDIRITPTDAMERMFCPGKPKPCVPRGIYEAGGPIYLDWRLNPRNSAYGRRTLLHELVHYVQEKSGRFPIATCATWAEREAEAYELEAQWLAKTDYAEPENSWAVRAIFQTAQRIRANACVKPEEAGQ